MLEIENLPSSLVIVPAIIEASFEVFKTTLTKGKDALVILSFVMPDNVTTFSWATKFAIDSNRNETKRMILIRIYLIVLILLDKSKNAI